MVGGHYHDIIVSSSGQGKCTFDIEKSSHKRDFTQSNKRKSTSFIITSSGLYWDSSTWTYLEFQPKNSEDNCETSDAERSALDTHTLSLLCCSRVAVKLDFDIEDITWPREDTNFIFECWKYLSRVSEANVWEILSAWEEKIRIPMWPCNVLFIL